MEIAFSKPEAHLRRIGARTFTDMVDALAEIRELYSPQECWNHFKATGICLKSKAQCFKPFLGSSGRCRGIVSATNLIGRSNFTDLIGFG